MRDNLTIDLTSVSAYLMFRRPEIVLKAETELHLTSNFPVWKSGKFGRMQVCSCPRQIYESKTGGEVLTSDAKLIVAGLHDSIMDKRQLISSPNQRATPGTNREDRMVDLLLNRHTLIHELSNWSTSFIFRSQNLSHKSDMQSIADIRPPAQISLLFAMSVSIKRRKLITHLALPRWCVVSSETFYFKRMTFFELECRNSGWLAVKIPLVCKLLCTRPCFQTNLAIEDSVSCSQRIGTSPDSKSNTGSNLCEIRNIRNIRYHQSDNRSLQRPRASIR